MSKRNLALATAVTLLTLTLGASGALAQQSAAQQKCLNAANKDGAGVAKTQGKENLSCLKGAGTGKLTGPAQACLTADSKGKVAKSKSKVSGDATKNCGTPPSFGFTSATTVGDAAVQGQTDLVADVFGANLDDAVKSCTSDKAGCGCQQKVLKSIEKLVDTKLATFVKCKQNVLKAGATSAASLRACVNDAGNADSIAADTKGKVAKGAGAILAAATKSCETPGVLAGSFPGTCNTAANASALATCLDVQVECRVCTIINEMDGIFVNCDLFDDGNPNGSCASGTGPTPTPTATSTPPPTPTATSTVVPTCTAAPGTVVKGSLTATNGRFNYNLIVGLPGADAACNSNFSGTHACALTELQGAPSSDLVCLKDTSSTTVTAFWAIDRSNTLDLQQCYDDASFPCPTGCTVAGHTWEYGTAHTGSRGHKVALNNSTGALSAVGGPVQCNTSGTSWVACCQ